MIENKLATINILLTKRISTCKKLYNIYPKLMEKNKDFYDNYINALNNIIYRIEEFIEANIELNTNQKNNLLESLLDIITLMCRDYSLSKKVLINDIDFREDLIESFLQIESILKECIEIFYSILNKENTELSRIILEELKKIIFVLALD